MAELIAPFDINGNFPLDKRQVFATLDDMYSFDTAHLPDSYFAICHETGKMYVYNKGPGWTELVSKNQFEIYNCNTDEEYHGLLKNTPNNQMIIPTDKNYTAFKIYYSDIYTNKIKYYEITADLINSDSTSIGMFIICIPSSETRLTTFEEVDVTLIKTETEFDALQLTAITKVPSYTKIEKIIGTI